MFLVQNNLQPFLFFKFRAGLAGNTPVAVGGTVNSNPDSWVQNGVHKNNDKTWNDPSMELSRQVRLLFSIQIVLAIRRKKNLKQC